MRQKFVFVLAAIALVGFLAPPVMAQAPAPKVTVTGLIQFAASISKNWNDVDVTNPKDTLSYTRERGRFDIIGEIGKSKVVWGVELDFHNGFGTTSQAGVSNNFDLDTDVAGVTENKWLYLEVPVTGAGSMMPFIPVATMMRAGAQPAADHAYKLGILWSGDFPGVHLKTTWAPNLRTALTYAQIGEALDRNTILAAAAANGGRQTEDWAVLTSVEWDIFKGLTLKPTYTFARYEGGNSGTALLGTQAKDGFNLTTAAGGTGGSTGAPRLWTRRHTFGADLRWASGPFSFQPTFLWQIGDQEIPINLGRPNKTSVDIRSWIVDLTGGWRIGPFNLTGRFAWTPGMEARHHVTNGSDINYYEPINPGFVYMVGWSEIQTSGIEYNNSLMAGCGGCVLRQSPSYDKYGRIFYGIRGDYQFTPALNLYSFLNFSWTDTDVDTQSVRGANGLAQTSTGTGNPQRGREDYIGTEWALGATYRFAPGVTLDMIFAYMWTGEALNMQRSSPAQVGVCTNGTAAGTACIHEAEDVYKAVARFSVAF
jgi:hypothetical protein